MYLRKDYYVYAYLRSGDSANGKAGSPYYIGKGRKDRISGRHKSASVPKDKTYVTRLAEGLLECDALQLEMFLIYIHGRINNQTGCLRNLTNGGEGTSGRVMSQELRELTSKRFKGKKHSPEQNEKNRLSKIGVKRKWSEEGRQRFMAAMKFRKVSEETKEKLRQANTGKKLSDQHRKSISLGQKGRKWSAESIAKISKTKTGTKHSQETLKKLSELAQVRNSSPEMREKFRLGAAKMRERHRLERLTSLPLFH